VARFTTWVLRHRRLVGIVWLALLAIGGVASARLNGRLSQNFDIPGTPSAAAARAIARTYDGGAGAPLVAVVRLPAGRAAWQPGVLAGLRAGFAEVARAELHGGRIDSYASTGDRAFASADGRTTFGLIYLPGTASQPGVAPGVPGAIGRALLAHLPPGTRARVTGIGLLTAAGGAPKGPGVLGEVLLGGLGALAVLAFVFASLLALVPLVIAAAALNTAFLAIFGMTYLTSVNVVVQYLAGLIGLGVAIDYSLLLVSRWREAAAAGQPNEQAIRTAMAGAGKAIVFSGVTVALGLLTLVVEPVPFIRGIGIAGMLIPAISVLVTLTIVPALLAGGGRRLDWPRLRREAVPARGWTAWARLVVRGRWAAAGAAAAILGALIAAALGLHLGDVGVNALSQQGPARQGVVLLQRAGIPAGVLTPLEVWVPRGADPARVAAAAGRLSGVRAAVAPAGPAWRRDGTAIVDVLPDADGSTPSGQAAGARVRQAAAAAAPGALVAGEAVGILDQEHALYGRFPWMLGGLALVTFALLAVAFRSVLLPLKAIAANLISVAAAYGVLVLVWQDGYGSRAIWGLPASGAITAWIPLFVFAFLYGLSMDYEVFLLSRMREEYDRTGSTERAVVTGVGRTGRLITSAALILFLAMAALASAPITFLKIFATGVGAGILLDATVVRSLLVPALVALFGRWNWWLPARARLVRRAGAGPDRAWFDAEAPGNVHF